MTLACGFHRPTRAVQLIATMKIFERNTRSLGAEPPPVGRVGFEALVLPERREGLGALAQPRDSLPSEARGERCGSPGAGFIGDPVEPLVGRHLFFSYLDQLFHSAPNGTPRSSA
jgi:hypothetical protein